MKKEKQSPFLSSSSHSTDEIFSASPFFLLLCGLKDGGRNVYATYRQSVSTW